MSASPLRVVVTGSRHWTDEALIEAALERCREEANAQGRIVLLAHGNAAGADRLAGRIGHEMGFGVCPYPVDTALDGPWPAAGHRRNARMLDEHRPELVVAFRAPGKSNGTDGCVAAAKGRGVPVLLVTP